MIEDNASINRQLMTYHQNLRKKVPGLK